VNDSRLILLNNIVIDIIHFSNHYTEIFEYTYLFYIEMYYIHYHLKVLGQCVFYSFFSRMYSFYSSKIY